jgi:flagellar FliL protein
MSDTPASNSKPKSGKKKLLLMIGGAILLTGGGVGAGLYATGSGAHTSAEADGPKLVPKSEQKRGDDAEKGGHGGSEEAAREDHGKPTPEGQGGDKYASNYYSIEKEFTANLQDSSHFVQVGIAVSTPYDETVIENLKTNEIAVRSAILMALGEVGEDQVFSADGKKQLQLRLAKAINATLKEKEGFGGVGNVYFTNFVVQ